MGAAPVSSQEGPGDRPSDPLRAGPPQSPPLPRGGAQAGGGAPGRRAAISSLAGGFASTSLGAFPAREPDPAALRGAERAAADGPGRGTQGERATEPSPSPARSGRRPHAARLTHRTGFRWEWARTERGRKSLLPPGRSGAEDLPCRTAPGLEEPVAPREPAAPGECAAPPHHPCPRPEPAPGRERRPQGSREGWVLPCAPARRTHARRSPKQRTESRRAGFRSGGTLGTGSRSGNFN